MANKWCEMESPEDCGKRACGAYNEVAQAESRRVTEAWVLLLLLLLLSSLDRAGADV